MGNDVTSRHLKLHLSILSELGHSLVPESQILDFGCGVGAMVAEYRNAGYDAYGCDLQVRTTWESRRVMVAPGNLTPINQADHAFLRQIDAENYRLPFADACFDFVFSDQVLEHVQNHARAFAEMKRVMKPGAISLHIFPAKLKPTEGHVFVPLGGNFQNRYWLTLWALLRVRNSFQTGKGFREVAELNFKYLSGRTNYLSKPEITAAVTACFDNVTFAENHFIKHTYGGARRLYPLVKWAPFIASLYSTFYCRVIFFQKPLRPFGTPLGSVE
jgi:SAM-dependent methyltransferase